MAEQGMNEELKWQDYLDPEHYNVPLHALRRSVLIRLSQHLDQEMMPNENSIVPDFGGLAELVGFDGLEISAMERARSPTRQLLEDWKNRPEFNPTVGRLVELLAQLGREDVLTDCQDMIRSEVVTFLERPQQFGQGPIQDETVSQGPGYDEIPRFVTRGDVIHGCEMKFDAFICYNPVAKDLEFVRELIKRFESSPYNFRLFVPHRDDLAGLNEHSINAKIISERCRHMIVVLSPNFLQSPACEFQSTFAHALSPGARNKRIVPIKIEECTMPNILRIMACCDFTKRDLWDWSWDRLAQSIMVPLSSSDFEIESSRSMDGLLPQEELDLNLATSSSQRSLSSSPHAESGYSSLPQQNSSSASSSGHRVNMTAPIDSPSMAGQSGATPMEMGSPLTHNHTAPVSSQGKKSATGPLKKFTGRFTSGPKKQKTKGKQADSQC